MTIVCMFHTSSHKTEVDDVLLGRFEITYISFGLSDSFFELQKTKLRTHEGCNGQQSKLHKDSEKDFQCQPCSK